MSRRNKKRSMTKDYMAVPESQRPGVVVYLDPKTATPIADSQGDGWKKKTKIDVNSDEFLKSYAWLTLRMKVFLLYGRRCLCCGATPESGAIMNVDHIKPRRLFPHLALDIKNLQVLCGDCNKGKGSWDQTDWRQPDDPIDPECMQHIREIARINASTIGESP